MWYYFSFFRFFRVEHPYLPNMFYDGKLIDLTQVGRHLYHDNIHEIADYVYNNFYVNNCFKFYLWAAFFFFMPIVALIDFSVNNMTTTTNLKTRQWYHN